MHNRVLAWLTTKLSRHWHGWVFTMPVGLARGLKRRYGYGFRPAWRLTAEERFIQSQTWAGKTVYDVGAYVGMYTLFFARHAQQVVAFEPNPANGAELQANAALNALTNVRLVPVGVGAARAELPLAVNPLYPSRSTFNMAWASQSGLAHTWHTVAVWPLDEAVPHFGLPAPDFVKIDVEGLEREVVRGMTGLLNTARPELFIELHGPLHADLCADLAQAGYTLWHVETHQALDPTVINAVAGGHVYARPA